MDNGYLTKKAFNIIKSSQSDISNWLSTIKLSMKAMSLDNIFSSPSCYSSAYVERMFKAKIRESFIQFWNSELNIADVNSIRNSKLRTYKMFKSKFGMEDYLINLHDFDSRKTVAKFRCSDHTLRIETGRHKKIDLEERMCKMCSQKRVEDERHFFLERSAYIYKIRKLLCKHVDPNEDYLNNQFIQLVASSNQNVTGISKGHSRLETRCLSDIQLDRVRPLMAPPGTLYKVSMVCFIHFNNLLHYTAG